VQVIYIELREHALRRVKTNFLFQVGFGGMGMLREHVLRGRVNADTVLAVEVEFCTHGFDGVGR
jgi:hypothetical protein